MITLMALVVATGRKRIGSDKREATLAVYQDGQEDHRLSVDLDEAVAVGDRYVVKIEKENA